MLSLVLLEQTQHSETIPVTRIGAWTRPDLYFNSSIDKGFRIDNYSGDFYSFVQSITCNHSYSNEQLAQMRQSPDTIVLNSQQTDSGSLNPGPFKSKLTMTIWAPERILNIFRQTPIETVDAYVVAVGEDRKSYLCYVGPHDTAHVKMQQLGTRMVGGKVTLNRGTSGDVGLTDIASIGIKSDFGVELNQSWSQTSGNELWYDFANTSDSPIYKHFYLSTKHHNADRDLAKYDDHGYAGDFSDSVYDYDQPTALLWYKDESSW